MKTFVKLLFIMMIAIGLMVSCNKQDDDLGINDAEVLLKSADSKTINFDMHDADPTWAYWSPLICDGDTVDILMEDIPGEEITVHVTAHLIDDKIVWAILHCKGTLTSEATGETFKIVDQTRLTFDENFELTSNIYHVHAKGDKGSRIMNFFELDYDAQTYVLTKSVCRGNDE